MQDIERKESMLRQQKSDTTRSAANILTSRYQQQAQAQSSQPLQPQAVEAQTPRYGMTPRDGQRQAANLQQQHQQSAWRLQSQPQWEQEHQQYIQYQQVQQQQQQHQHMMTKQQRLLENEQKIMRNLPNSNSRSSSAASGAIQSAIGMQCLP
jgi:hypothetical protein